MTLYMEVSMARKAILHPTTHRVNRTKLRQSQCAVLKKASGRSVVLVQNQGGETGKEKCILDKAYLDELLRELRGAVETIEIMMDPVLFPRLLKTAETLDEDMRLGKLHSFEEVFGKGEQ